MNKIKNSIKELRVVFDTSVLYTQVASDLLKHEVAELIRQNSSHDDIGINWYIPVVVRHERQFQMQKEARKFLGPLARLEKLLGRGLKITEEKLMQRVEQTIEAKLAEHGIQSLSVDWAKVDWNTMMLDAAYRRPPFEDGEKEKGFRDALIAEAFAQLVARSPTERNACTIILLTNDSLLTEAVTKRTSTARNVKIMQNLEEIKGFINTITSHVDEELVTRMQKEAEKLFYEENNPATLFYTADILVRIEAQFEKQLSEIPDGADYRRRGSVQIRQPRFIKKQGKQVSWATRLSFEAQAFKRQIRESSLPPTIGTGSRIISTESTNVTLKDPLLNLTPSFSIPPRFSTLYTMAGQVSPLIFQPERPVKIGESLFEVEWSTTLNVKGALTTPTFHDVRYLETTWSEN